VIQKAIEQSPGWEYLRSFLTGLNKFPGFLIKLHKIHDLKMRKI
jgi:hypothetical protein